MDFFKKYAKKLTKPATKKEATDIEKLASLAIDGYEPKKIRTFVGVEIPHKAETREQNKKQGDE